MHPAGLSWFKIMRPLWEACVWDPGRAGKKITETVHTHIHSSTSSSLLIKQKASQSTRPHLPSEMVAKLPLFSLWEGQIAVSVYGGKMSVCKIVLKIQNVQRIFGLLGQNFPAETLHVFIFCGSKPQISARKNGICSKIFTGHPVCRWSTF